jgi:hypothetical protein
MSEWKAQRVERKLVQRGIVDARPLKVTQKPPPGDWLVVMMFRGRWSVYSTLRTEAEAFKQAAKTQSYSRRYVVHRDVFNACYRDQR